MLNTWIFLIVYTLMNIYARVGLTHYIDNSCLVCCCWERIAKASVNWKSSMRIYFNRSEQDTIRYPLVLDVCFLLHIGKYWFLVSRFMLWYTPSHRKFLSVTKLAAPLGMFLVFLWDLGAQCSRLALCFSPFPCLI